MGVHSPSPILFRSCARIRDACESIDSTILGTFRILVSIPRQQIRIDEYYMILEVEFRYLHFYRDVLVHGILYADNHAIGIFYFQTYTRVLVLLFSSNLFCVSSTMELLLLE